MEKYYNFYDNSNPLNPYTYSVPAGEQFTIELKPLPMPAQKYDENGTPLGPMPEQEYEEIRHPVSPPESCIMAMPEEREGFWPVLNAMADGWEYVEDHRKHRDAQGREIEDSGTAYWLPQDSWQSQGQYTKDLGPLPKEAVLQKPEKPLAVAQDEKMWEIATAHERALSGAVALSDPTPSTVAIESSLLAVSDPEGLEYVRDQLATRRAELEAAVQAATTVLKVEGIAVSFAV